jgi:enediyne polyketide synthase
LLAPYLERRLGELVPGSGASVAVVRNGASANSANGDVTDWMAARHEASERAVAEAVGDVVQIYRRADGKPMAVADQAVSVSHAAALTFSIASERRLVGCDAEAVVHRDVQRWTDLLGAERAALARLVAQQGESEDFDAAATRLWSAGECLKKAGLPLDTPLVFRDATPDGWVLLGAGSVTVATWIGAVRDRDAPLTVALLVGSGDEVL